MTHDELERRIALIRSVKSSIEGHKVPKDVLKDLLPDGPGTKQSLVPPTWAKKKRNGVIGVTVYRRGENIFYRAHIRTPDGKDVKSPPYREWWRAVRQRNRWAERYYPGMPEFKCDYEAAMDLWSEK